VTATAGHLKDDSELEKEFFPLGVGPADCHRPTIDDETQIEHNVRYRGVPFVVLKADASAIVAGHAEDEKGAQQALLEGIAHLRANGENAVVVNECAVTVI
jgi:hypothetical protein